MGGFQATDNGFARFNHVRIPKEQMLSKFARVTDEGEYVQPPHAKLSYGGVSPSLYFLLPIEQALTPAQMLYIRSGWVSALVEYTNDVSNGWHWH